MKTGNWIADGWRMRVCTVLIAIVVGAAGASAPPACAEDEPDLLALQDVTIVDLQNGSLRSGQTVMWERSRIIAAGPSDSIETPDGARVISGKGRFLMPGLWDMHVHVEEERILPLYIAYGVTGVRDMSDSRPSSDYRRSAVSEKRRWDAEARAGLRVGPRIVAAGTILVDGPSLSPEARTRPKFFNAETPAEARKLVRFFVDEGAADFIKVYSNIPRASYFAMLDEARRFHIEVSGHKPMAVGYIEAADAGQRTFEHARAMLQDSFPGAMELRRNPGDRNSPPARLKEILDQHDPHMLQEIFAALDRNHAYYVPTHLTRLFDWKAVAADPNYLNDPRLRQLAPEQREVVRRDVARTQKRGSHPGDAAIYKAFFAKVMDVTRQAQEAGVKMMVGTDSGDSYCFHGSGLHDELQWMVKAGLSPLEALRAATIIPAEYVGRSDDFGAIQAGRIADMVLLDENPLADIDATRKINAVVFNGRFFDQKALDEMIKGAEFN